MEKTNKRTIITELIKTGEYTKAQIAEKIGMKEAGVSSQLTYLRWMGNFIIWDADKKLCFVNEADYNSWMASRTSSTKKAAKKSSRPAGEQLDSLEKTIATQTANVDKWKAKLELIEADGLGEDLATEAQAQITLLSIKLKRNVKRLAELEATFTTAHTTPADDEEDDNEGAVDGSDDEELL